MKKLTQQRVKELFDYDPKTGILIWKVQKAKRTKIGDIAGYEWDGSNRRRVGIDGKYYYTSRVAWLWYYGWLPKYLDHEDTDPSNDRIKNLRVSTFSQNQMNRGPNKNHSLGIKNVYKQNGRFLVRITADGVSHTKSFVSLKEAKDYAGSLRTKLHAEFARAA